MKKALVVAAVAIIVAMAFSTSSFADVTLYGRGHGHGVGVSMAGVYGMAKAGYNYQQILNYYYPNITWGARDDNTVIRAKCAKHGSWHNLTVRDYLSRLAEEPDSWPTEGLRATIVAARTYLWYKIDKHGYFESGQYWIHDINPATRPNIVAAVNDTANQVLFYNGSPIVAAYSASAGGYTARASEVWGGSDTMPYWVNRESSYDSVFSSIFKWTKNLSNSAIEKAYPSIGQFQNLVIEERSSADYARSRVKKIRINGTSGTVLDKGWNFKGKMGLKSNFFFLEPWPEFGSSNPAPSPSPDNTRPKTLARSTAKYSQFSKNKASHFLNRYRAYKKVYKSARTAAGKKKYLNLANKYYKYYRIAKKGITPAKLYWRVDDTSDSQASVKLVIQKRTYTAEQKKLKARYNIYYKRSKARYKRTKNATLRKRYYHQARIYFKRYRKIKPGYTSIKTVRYGLTTINTQRAYSWNTKNFGQFRYLVFAADRAGNSQENVALGSFTIKK